MVREKQTMPPKDDNRLWLRIKLGVMAMKTTRSPTNRKPV
jgi:hypothetical protein